MFLFALFHFHLNSLFQKALKISFESASQVCEAGQAVFGRRSFEWKNAMSDLIKYKGYSGSVEYSKEDECFFGKVQSVRSLLLYDGASLNELMVQFRQVVDDYLEDCRVDGVEPERPELGALTKEL